MKLYMLKPGLQYMTITRVGSIVDFRSQFNLQWSLYKNDIIIIHEHLLSTDRTGN